MRIRVLLVALAFAASATVASGLQLRYPRQENLLLGACDTALTNIGSTVADASRTQVQTIETVVRVLRPGRLAGYIAFGRPGAKFILRPGAGPADHWNLLARIGAAKRGKRPASFAWAIALHYSPVR